MKRKLEKKVQITVLRGISNAKCDVRKHTTKAESSIIIMKISQIGQFQMALIF